MIIQCESCSKKFAVRDNDIPKKDILNTNNQAKSNKSDILVLDQMIE